MRERARPSVARALNVRRARESSFRRRSGMQGGASCLCRGFPGGVAVKMENREERHAALKFNGAISTGVPSRATTIPFSRDESIW